MPKTFNPCNELKLNGFTKKRKSARADFMTFFDLRTGNHSDGALHLRGWEGLIEEVCLFAREPMFPGFLHPFHVQIVIPP